MAKSPDITPVDATPWLTPLIQWFGFPEDIFEPYSFVQSNPKTIHMVSKHLDAPLKPAPLASGIAMMSINMAHPKLSTSAAMILGAKATRQTLELNPEQVDLFLKRTTQSIPLDMLALCNGTGYVILRHQGVALGVGLLRWVDRAQDGLLESMFPKAHKLNEGRSAFAQA